MIDPLIWEDEHFGKLSDKAKILFIACISNADDDGRLSGNPANLRAMAFRFDDVSSAVIEVLVKEIADILTNFKPYEVNDCKYIQLGKWEEYQTQREDRRKPSKLPSCQSGVRQKSTKGLRKISKDKISEVKLSNTMSSKPDLDAPILYLNKKTNNDFDPRNKSTKDIIKARYNEGRTLEQFKIVIDKKVAQWLTNDKMMAYLRPSTLFSRTNFENYLNEPESADTKIKKLMEET